MRDMNQARKYTVKKKSQTCDEGEFSGFLASRDPITRLPAVSVTLWRVVFHCLPSASRIITVFNKDGVLRVEG